MRFSILPMAFMAAVLYTQACAQVPSVPAGAAAVGNITCAQALQRADGLFDQFDTDHDGKITWHEAKSVGKQLMAERMALHRDVAPGLGGHTLRYLEQTFANSEFIDRQQFEQAMLAHFDQMDVNHDGILTPAERSEGKPSNPTESDIGTGPRRTG